MEIYYVVTWKEITPSGRLKPPPAGSSGPRVGCCVLLYQDRRPAKLLAGEDGSGREGKPLAQPYLRETTLIVYHFVAFCKHVAVVRISLYCIESILGFT